MTLQTPVKETQTGADRAPTAGTAGSSIVDKIPAKLVMILAAPYIAGRSAEDAMARAQRLWHESRYASTIDILGEDAVSDEDCDQSVENYKRVIDMAAVTRLDAARPNQQITVSFKPSMFSTRSPLSGAPDKKPALEKAARRIEAITAHAAARGVPVTLEAEDHRWTDFHLDVYFALVNAGYRNLGTVLQSRLFRTKKDLLRFDERTRVRMVIGIYNEPADIAYTQKPVMKEMAVNYAAELLSRGTYVELASHDTDCLRNFFVEAVMPNKAAVDQFEVQMLLGVPRAGVQKSLIDGSYFGELAKATAAQDRAHCETLAQQGCVLRMYLPFGTEQVAGPYCKRRLKANPNMVLFGIKNVLGLQS